ncbi:hypothetical protein JBL43_19705 [Aureibaculum sp. A20]|uniref:Uncharacterized protein n=1 Tax=Aureibaculum flavum TaxID=2795986 RepID=A0ABS0WWY4_9FLAO|nr:hypothetical protein [Aureibaculum flavum]MBJ2176486.1 hypothetical protein [Aureibaculum flavum]
MKKIFVSILTLLGLSCGNPTEADNQSEKIGTGIFNTLVITSQKFEKINNAFLINLIKDNVVTLQILHGGMLEQTRTAENVFNFSFNLTFDNEKANQDKFTTLDISKDFTYYEYEGIPCYAFNAGNDTKKVSEIALLILEKVYGYNQDEVFEFEIHDQGQM